MSQKQRSRILIFTVLLLLMVSGALKIQRKTSYTQNPFYYVSSEISPNGRYRIDSFSGDYTDRYNYYQIFLTNLKTDETKRLYSSDFRTTDWQWTPDNKVKVTYNCGTGCRATKFIGVDERVAISEEGQGMITEANGWNVEFIKSF